MPRMLRKHAPRKALGSTRFRQAERRAASQEEVLGVLGQGVQQMRSEQARHSSELKENLRAEQRRWRQGLLDVQAQHGEQQQLLEALELRLESCEGWAKELRRPREESRPPREELRGRQELRPDARQEDPQVESRVEDSRPFHPHPEMVKRLEVGQKRLPDGWAVQALEGRFREPRGGSQAASSPRAPVETVVSQPEAPQRITFPFSKGGLGAIVQKRCL